MYWVTRLQNALTVATAEMPHMTGVSVGIWVGVGSRYERVDLNGASHFIEHLLFKGTRKRSARDISEAVEGVGGSLNAFTSEETTCFHARAGHERFEEVLDVLVDMLLGSKFAPQDIAKEREVIKEEMAMYLDEPQHHVQELLNETLWPDQPLGRPITGTEATLDCLRRPQLVGFLKEFYVTGSTVVVSAGNIRHRDALRAVSRYARHFTPGKRRTFLPAEANQPRTRVRLFTKKTEQTQLALGIRTCSRHDEHRFPLRLLNTILGENMSSRLFQVIREDRGLAYSIYSTPSFFADTGDLVISAGCDTEHVEETLTLVMRELRRLRETPPSRWELKRARDFVLGQIDLGQDSTEIQMNWVGEQLLGYGKVIPPSEIKQRLACVTATQIRTIACDFFQPHHLNLAVVGPLSDDQSLRRAVMF